ncbi:hypothetical protein J3Q64DRAFT_1836141 [Phycomyces blakesleeanus]|uniref:Uncharacterized protein n=2 Tax=Phycomyces blakesleeanus TaxID=4837 RepID=A0A162PTK0_PHYB8|nr:hypothetical protein PHYBLDRAFT_145268 [Phycomyces blakesleeanus NRRL 1555(-)]OAD73796.1 hypothetical protein PHYBLDRAFT_145268 [Phycomyces blakesleeanus NRRL 1555(-)]|eukprot:XP_018291836.1 hypothetical protein PHYBLDRAFT_145268 [Phycomyces blakesleeanus NRRL 1555(-)]
MNQPEHDDAEIDEGRDALVNNVIQLQSQLRGLIARVDSAKNEHHSLLTENQMLQKYINNSLTSTAVFGATGGAVNPAMAQSKSGPEPPR